MDKKKKIISLVLFLAILIYGFYLRILVLDSVVINEWVTRDFDRAFNLLSGNYIPLAGPDLTNGGRLPGPFMYFFLAIPLLLEPSYETLFNYNFILNVASIFLVFIISKKYFNIYYAVITTSLVAIDINHIGAVHFPINPAFIMIFLVLFVGTLFELCIKRNEKVFPLLVLIISLGVQFHYQITTYILIPLIAAIIFKIKISKKSIILSFLILALSFLPYTFYKAKTFNPVAESGLGAYDKNLEDSFVTKVIKSLPVQKTIDRLFLMQPFDMTRYAPESIRIISRIVFSLAFYFLILYIGFKSFKDGKEKYGKEILLIILFYIPAFIFDLIRPFIYHYWYNYIFILPKAYILTSGTIVSIGLLRNKTLKFLFLSTAFILIASLCVYNFKTTLKAIHYFNKDLQNVNNVNSSLTGSYKNSKLLLNTFMDTLGLTSREYYDRVYFVDFHASSYKRIQLIKNDSIETGKNTENKISYPCFFIVDQKGLEKYKYQPTKDPIPTSKLKIFQAFLEDQTISVETVKEVSFIKKGFVKLFSVYQYRPKFKQSCYQNSHNPFVVNRNIRNLLQDAKTLNVSKSKISYRKLSLNEEYDSNSELLFWEGEYIILNPLNNTPFRLTVKLQKENDMYSVQAAIDSFFYFASGSNNFNYLNILITPIKEQASNIQSKNTDKDVFLAPILAENMLLTRNGLNGSVANEPRNYNQNWYRELLWSPKTKLIKGNFTIEVIWQMYRDKITKMSRLKLENSF